MLAAQHLLICTPMYNFSIPSALKAWIDQLVRIQRSFRFDGERFEGLLGRRNAHVALAYGAVGYLNGGPYSAADFTAPYLRFVLNFLGISEVHVHAVEGTSGDAANLEAQFTRIAQDLDRAPR